MTDDLRDDIDRLPELPEPDASSDGSAVDRRAFLMRSAVLGAAAVITGRTLPASAQAAD